MPKLILWAALLLGVVLVTNGSFMLLAPEPRYWAIKGVAERGPFNQHFIRDVGIVYMICGGAFMVGGLYVAQRVSLWLPAAAFTAGHGLGLSFLAPNRSAPQGIEWLETPVTCL